MSTSTLLIKKSQSTVTREHDVSAFREYALPFTKLSMGISEIDGKYPSEGYDVDTSVDAVWYVMSGSGLINVGETTYSVETGDMIMIPKNEQFWIEGKHLQLVVASSPPWTSPQHKHIEEHA